MFGDAREPLSVPAFPDCHLAEAAYLIRDATTVSGLPHPARTTMRTRLTMITLITIVLFAGLVPWTAVAQTTPTASTSSLIVKVIAGLTADQQAAIVGRNGGTVTSSIPALRLLVVSVPQDDVAATLARYQADAQVQSAETNKVRVSESMPSDALYANQWALPRIGWDQVFGVVTPTGSAKVALLDTGVDASHPELAGKVVPGTSILDGSDGMTDPSGHGTWLAGIIAARTNNGLEGIAGVAYDGVTVMPVTVLNANGEGQDSDVIAGVVWAADHGADVILMAFSNPGFSPNLQDAIDYAWSRGAVIVASAGNNASSEPHFPAGDRGVMGVAATDQGDGQASFSNEGQAVFIAAPGTDIATTEPGGAYTAITGTSAAAAHVAGLAAFMKAVNPALPNGVIVFRIASTADPAGTQIETGNGRINMARAVASTATDFIQPVGADPVGNGGPFVGPYQADAVGIQSVTVLGLQTPSPVVAGNFATYGSSATNSVRVRFNGNNGSCTVSLSVSAGLPAGATATFDPASLSSGVVTPGGQTPDRFSLLTINTSAVTPGGTHALTVRALGTAGDCLGDVRTADTTLVVTAANTAPTVAFTAGPTAATESGATEHTYSFSITDPDAGDSWSFVSGYPTCGVGGSLVAGSATINSATKTGSFKCIFADGDANPIVAVKVKDAANAESNEATRGVTVSNVAPTVAFTAGPTTVGESGVTQHTYNYSISDPGNDTIISVITSCGANGTKVTGSDTNTNTSGSFQCIFPNGPASSTVTAQATDSDGAPSNTAERGVTVNNVAPTVAFTAGPTTADESGVTQHTYNYSITDPGNDAITSVSTSCGANGMKVAGSDTNDNTSGSFRCIFPDGPATSTVSAQATDSDGGASNPAERVVSVSNVAPTVAFTAGATTVDESGVTEHTYSYSITDPGDDTISVSTSCGANGIKVAGSDTNTNTNGSFRCIFPDGPAYSTVTVQATDSDGAASNTAERVVKINNVAPTVAFTAGPTTVNESGLTQHSYSYSIGDPGNDTITSVNTSCGANGIKVTGSDTNTNTSGSFQCIFPDGPAASTVSAQATDSDGAPSNTAERGVTVNNVAPTVAFTVGPTTADESGVTQHTYSYSITDPGDDTITSVTTSCGANGMKVASSDTNDNTSGSFKCIFPDGPATSTVSAQATDSDGAAGNTAPLTVNINNVAPTITGATGPGPTAVNTSVSIKADFTDPGSFDTHTCQFAWGDGTAGPDATAAGTGNGSCTGTHAYSAAGVYTVLITVKDKDDGVSAVFSYEFVVIYDPSAGFVTGGGWIMSPSGAYIPQPTATGKANFGFVSKYKKGATVPTGETQFQFHAGGMNFHSEEYQYLVIAGVKAQYKGIGAVNGAGNYGFLLTATDGNLKTGDGIDRFRIKIWDRATGVIVYDNAPSADPDTEDLNQIFPQAISGGSIVIHSGK
jgi:subtilisin family serine protease